MINPGGIIDLPAVAIEPTTNALSTFVLILHTIFVGAGNHVTTTKIQGYSEQGCDAASRAYEAAGMLSIHGLREGGDKTSVVTMIAICIPGPDGAP